MNIFRSLINRRRLVALAVCAGVVPAAGVAAATTEPPADTTATESTSAETMSTEPAGSTGASVDLDTNGDGEVVIGVATPGPRDDGGYYQAMVDGIIQLAEENGFAEPIIVDNIAAAEADTELRNLARQNVDVIAVGAGELSDPLPALSEEFGDIFWYCNCGAGLGDAPGVAQALDDSSQISYSAGYATGLLMQDQERNPSGSTSATFLGCCELDFETEAFLAFQAGLQAVDDSFTVTYVPTGDFNDVAAATEAFNQAAADGVAAVYPFLGGSQEAVAGLANEAGIITMAPGPADACEREDPHYDIAVVFDAGVYVNESMRAIIAGELEEGATKQFLVGEFEPVGAEFCDATPEQEEALQAVRDQIAAGEFDALFGEIKGEAYGGGGAPVTTG